MELCRNLEWKWPHADISLFFGLLFNEIFYFFSRQWGVGAGNYRKNPISTFVPTPTPSTSQPVSHLHDLLLWSKCLDEVLWFEVLRHTHWGQRCHCCLAPHCGAFSVLVDFGTNSSFSVCGGIKAQTQQSTGQSAGSGWGFKWLC